ncbi:hemagglutinin repeat-containing protein [Limnohabitans sp. G3-2]|uniref:hemagglutinin repeat-containing protein n=1 Tax=Limnohabitans sp. G3-2 TaxID=1100711 RepID=UPI000C1E256E|nr:hemagglutinin repeat-containing protein [Limnohabitans sp. G3-2]PIT74199.1 hypothetical protein B9Z31_10195 [Limnohabitans sp. G3-2]
MNKTRHRIVFNKARGCLMAVAETAMGHGQGASGATRCGAAHPGQLRLSVLGLVCKWLAGTALVCLPLAWLAPLQAQTVTTRIVADPTAPSAQRPTVLTTSNGVVQVDIRTPSAAGVSRNTYSQFDVGAAGAVLNNSRTPVQTQQGGWVQGNPWLATGSARVILNEVNSSNPSYLQGYVEVAGQRAQVIVANPSGMAINGGGFINASTATLTTGTAIMNAGALESFRVQGGQMTIEGQGLDARSTDYTAILSRALQVNAGIWAQQLQVVTGANDIAAASVSADTTVQSNLLASSASPPIYALDVAALGGMYAGKITLIGTEAGLGVRNAGLLQASSGPLTLSHQGWLSNSGTLQASGGDVVVQTQGTMVQSGTVYSERHAQLTSQGSQTHSGVVAALGSVQIQAKDTGISTNTGSSAPQILASATTVWAAGMRADGSLETLPSGATTGGQTLHVSADGLLQTAGQALGTQALSLQAASLDVSQSRQQAPSIHVQATTGELQAAGSRILAAQTLRMQTTQTLTTDRAQLQGEALTLHAKALSNVAGQITQTGQADQSLALQGQLNNTAGTIYSAARHLNIRAQGIDNTAGQILHAGQGTLSIDSQGDLINTVQSHTQAAVIDGARIIGSGAVQVSAQTLTNSGSIYAAQDLSSTVKSLANSGSLYAAGSQTLTVAESLQTSGTIAAAKDLNIHAASVAGISTNVLAAGMAADGQLSGTGTLTVNTSGTLQSAGQLLATNGMSLTGSALNLAGSHTGTTAGDVSLIANNGDINARKAQVSTPGKLTLTANSQATQKLDNTEGQISAQQLNIRVGQLVNDHGAIEQTGTGVQTTSINTLGSLDNTSGRIVANAINFMLNAGALTNTSGLMGHAGTGLLKVDAMSLDNTQGKITGNGTVQISTSDKTTNANGLISAQQNMTLSAGGITNTKGTLVSINGQVSLQSKINGLDNRQGLIQAKENLDITLSGAENSLQNALGQIIAGREILLSTGTLNTTQGLVSAGRDLQIDTHGQTLSNQGTRSADPHAPTQGLIAGGQLVIQSGGVDNRSGLIHAQGDLTMTSTGAVNNSALSGNSQIYSGGEMMLKATGLNNAGSQMLAVQSMTADVASGTIDNSQALMRTGQNLTLLVGAITNANTRATASDGAPAPTGLEGQNVVLSASNIDNTQGAFRAVHNLNIQSDGLLHNDHGQLSAGQQLHITTGTNTPPTTAPTLRMSNDAGLVVADRSVVVRAGRLSGAGQIVSQGDVSLSLQSDHTLAGTLQAGGELQLQTTGTLINPVTVQAGKNLSITAGNLDNQASGQLLSAQTTTLQISHTLTNRGLIDGADTHIQGANVNNLGSGRMYGDRLAIASNTLINQEEAVGATTRAATIAGRERVDMGVQTLTNRENALIYSGGGMTLGGALNTNWRSGGTAQSIHNNSATIEATQALTIQATNIRNTNEHFVSQVQQISQTSIIEYQHAPGDVASASDNSTRFAASVTRIWDCESYCMTTVAGTSDAFVLYNYTRTIDASVVTQTAPGQIRAGQGITMTADTVLNDKSQILAGGSLSVQARRVDNQQGEGTQITTDAGTATSIWRARRNGRDTSGSSTGTYAPAASTQTIGMNAARYEQNAASASTSTAPADSTLSSVQTQADAAGGVTRQMLTAGLISVAGTQANIAQGSVTTAQANAQSPSTQTQVRTQNWRTTVPNTSLYHQHPEAGAKYLVESDPQFTQYKTWLGSDFMTAQLQFDPATSQKRMGDGFYEQKLVREQVQALTGQRFLGDYSNDQTQYMALMNNGLTTAKALKLRPGIALSAAQVAQLTSDMVWLVTQEVTLADGSKQSVLVPQVYVRVQPGDVDGTGALLAGRDVQLNLNADATNSGTIAGRNLVQINANNIQNMGGKVSGAAVAMQATQDINNIGGQIQAQNAALLSAGRDINLRTTTQSSSHRAGNNSFSQTGIDRVAGLYVSGPAGVLIANAGRDFNLTAAQISNQGSGPNAGTTLSAAQNINLGTVSTANSQDIRWSGVNYLRQSSSQDEGSQIGAAGNLTLSAGQDINAKAASINAGQTLSVAAQRDVTIGAGQTSQSLDTANTVTSKGMLSSRTLSTRQTSQSTTAVASNLEGASVSIAAGQDLTVTGSNVLADQAVNLSAMRNVTTLAAQNTQNQTDYRQETKSGLMSGGGIGFTVGKRQQSLDQQGQSTSAAPSTIGAINGNVTIKAGGAFTQTGSDVMTPKGDIAITAQKVDITEARETGSQSTEQKFKQSGLTVAITSPVVSALQTVQSQLQAAGNTSSGRMQALAGANAAFNLKQAADAVKAGQGDANGMVKDAKGNLVEGNAADKAGGIGISISLGSSSSQSKQSSSADNARGSSINAGGNITIQATGDGQVSNLTVQGSSIQAAGTTTLKADNQVNLLAAQNTTHESSSDQSKSASVGVAIQLGAGGGGMGFTASASKATGQGAGNGVTYTNTQVAGSAVGIESGGDTTLKGAVVKADQVTAQVGGNLTIESLQDQNQYKESSKSAGGSIMVGAGFSGSLNIGQSKINSTFTSVNEQSAIRAGDGGFQVEVKGNTTLTGGQITSTKTAIDNNKDNNKNSFQTGGTLATTDLQNSASYEAKSVSVGLGAGSLPGKSASAGMSGVGFGSDKDSAQSTSTAGISGVAGNTAARTGDKEAGIKTIFDADRVKKEIETQVTITQEFGKQAGKAITEYTNGQRKTLQEQAKNASTPEEKAKAEQAIKDVNMQERALNILTGALTGMVGSVITKEALSTAAEKMRDLMIEDSKKFAGVVDSTGKVLSNVSGPSEGVRGDGVKVGGTRLDLDVLCGPDSSRCTFVKNQDGTIDTSKPVTFDGRVKPDGTRETFDDFLKTLEGQKMVGATGGLQGAKGTLFGLPYAAGSWQDKLIESFAGSHDYIGGKASGLYDEQGNAARARSDSLKILQDRWSEAAIPLAAPFAAAEGMSPEVWKAIGILLGAGK